VTSVHANPAGFYTRVSPVRHSLKDSSPFQAISIDLRTECAILRKCILSSARDSSPTPSCSAGLTWPAVLITSALKGKIAFIGRDGELAFASHTLFPELWRRLRRLIARRRLLSSRRPFRHPLFPAGCTHLNAPARVYALLSACPRFRGHDRHASC